jgi:microcystin degradation protein MlrC
MPLSFTCAARARSPTKLAATGEIHAFTTQLEPVVHRMFRKGGGCLYMKIFAGGIATETNTFSPIPTGQKDFTIQRGGAALEGQIDYPSLDLSKTWGKQAQARGYEFAFSLMAWAMPSGTTVRSVYEGLRDELLNDLRAEMPVDIVLLNLHGAMVAQGYDDCEEDTIRRVRDIVGPTVVIGVELDLHCHLSESMIALADIVVTYKEYPHVDVNDRSKELFDLAIEAKLGNLRPTMALFDCRMIGMYPTSRQPLRGFVDAMTEAERRNGVLSISFGHGFQFADVPHVGAKVLTITHGDRALAERIAREFGLRVYGLRKEIGFDSISLPMETALFKALASKNTPVVVADQSDNIGGGAPGDSTFALHWLLDHRAEDVAMAIFYDPGVVEIAKNAGKGSTISVRLGGKLGRFSGTPVDIEVAVLSTLDNYMHALPQQIGEPWLFPVGDVVALRCGSIDIVVGSERCQCFSPSIFSDLGIDPKRKRLLIPKSYQHFYSGFASIAGEIIYMAAPGAVAPDPKQIPYRRLDTSRLYPWVDDPLEQNAQS